MSCLTRLSCDPAKRQALHSVPVVSIRVIRVTATPVHCVELPPRAINLYRARSVRTSPSARHETLVPER